MRRHATFVALLWLLGCGGDGGPVIPHHLQFAVQPSAVLPGLAIAPGVEVTVVDSLGNQIRGVSTPITLALGTNPGGGTLTGTTTVNAVNGSATFTDLKIDSIAASYTLTATAAGLPVATSATFPVTRPMVMVTTGGDGSYTVGFSCGVAVGGAAYCWGYNGDGALGTGSTVGPDYCGLIGCGRRMALVTGGHTFVSVSAGINFACGITTTGPAYCWGINTYGQLGDGTTTSSAAPVLVAGAQQFSEIDAGYFAACGVTTSGAGYCWGWNNAGQLGNGTNTGPEVCLGDACSSVPVAISGNLTFKQVGMGYGRGCGVTTGGTVYCWGSAPLGDSTSNASLTPVAIAPERNFSAISVSDLQQCAITTTTGLGYCWGNNGQGQLGDGTFEGRLVPVRVGTALDFVFTTLSTGNLHTCGASASGETYCWGYGSYGALGNGTYQTFNTPQRILGDLQFKQVSAAVEHTCGVTLSGVPYCWGHNAFGELGRGTATQRSNIPAAVLP